MASTFVTNALAKINNDPYQRLTPATLTMVQDARCIYDAHCHIFDRTCVSIFYFLLRLGKEKLGLSGLLSTFNREMGVGKDNPAIKLMAMPGNSKAIYKAIAASKGRKDTTAEWRALEKYFNAVTQTDARSLGITAAEFRTSDVALGGIGAAIGVLLKGNMEAIYDMYRGAHCLAALPDYSNRPFVTVVLAMDLDKGWGQGTPKPYHKQVDELNELAGKKPILPFLALDPRRQTEKGKGNLYKLFERAFCQPDSHFFGVKFYPALGYAPSDPRFHEFFEICEQKNIPVVSHCGEEIISTFEKKVKINRCTTRVNCSFENVPGKTREDRAEYLNEPREWEHVMNMFPKLRLNLGHFGGSEAWHAIAGNVASKRVSTIQGMMNKFPGVYADFSYNFIEDGLDQPLLKEMNKNPIYQDRCMFGTDYWVVLPAGDIRAKQSEFLDTLSAYRDRLISTNPKRFLFG